MGVLYCRAGQASEEDMYNNREAGPAFMQFLTLLGDVVRLKGFESYRAQLDTKSEVLGDWGVGGGWPWREPAALSLLYPMLAWAQARGCRVLWVG